MNYKEIIHNAILKGEEAMKLVNPEPIGKVVNSFSKQSYNVSCGLFGRGCLLLKKRNRKLCNAMQEYCKEHGYSMFYSDYNKARCIGLGKTMEYERLLKLYYTIRNSLLNQGIDSKLIEAEVRLD